MNNPNPFDVQRSLQERVNQARSRLRLSVFITAGIAVITLTVLLMQGCKREEPATPTTEPPPDTNAAVTPTFVEPTNPPPAEASNPPAAAVPGPVVMPPVAPPAAASNPPPAEVPGEMRQHVVAAGDSFYSLSRKYGVSIRAIAAANPGVEPKKLKVGQKLNIPAASAASSPTAPTGATAGAGSDTGEALYVVKSGDTLARIARRHGTSVRAIKAANNLATDHIKVGQKLKLPVKAAAPAPTTNTPSAPPADTTAPVPPPAR